MNPREFPHPVALAKLATRPTVHHLVADASARAALAERFGLQAIERLEGELEVSRKGAGAVMTGKLVADVVQTCVVSGEPVPAHVEEELSLRFEPAPDGEDEVELDAESLDVHPVEGDHIDLGEALAQSLVLALEPYPRAAPEVLDRVRRHLMSESEAEELASADKQAANPFAKLRPQ